MKVKHIIEWQEVTHYRETFVYFTSAAAADVIICCKMLIDQIKSCHVETYCSMKGKFDVQPGFETPP